MLFVGYVNALVVEQCLMEQIPGELFSPRIVLEQEPQVLDCIAGENEFAAKARRECEEELSQLTECIGKLEQLEALYRKSVV